MTTVELEILDHLNTNWNLSPTISWAYSNVVFTYRADQEYLIPTMTTLNSEILEVPAESGAIRVDYSLGLNLLLIENTGMSSAKTYTDKLRTIFHKKNIQTSSHLYNFLVLEVEQGFSSGAHFELPVSIQFFIFSN